VGLTWPFQLYQFQLSGFVLAKIRANPLFKQCRIIVGIMLLLRQAIKPRMVPKIIIWINQNGKWMMAKTKAVRKIACCNSNFRSKAFCSIPRKSISSKMPAKTTVPKKRLNHSKGESAVKFCASISCHSGDISIKELMIRSISSFKTVIERPKGKLK